MRLTLGEPEIELERYFPPSQKINFTRKRQYIYGRLGFGVNYCACINFIGTMGDCFGKINDASESCKQFYYYYLI